MSAEAGTILHLQRLSTEDGPGLRTTVFLKGCPLHCAWCHNPESISMHHQVQWLENRCIACKTCLEACPNHALSWSEGGAVRDRELCQVCGVCAEICPANAHEMLGQEIRVGDLVKELLKDRAYFSKSGGGVTLSGGEPTMQLDFSLALLRALREKNVATAIDTCGLCQPEVLKRLAAEVDLILFDLKLMDADAHQAWTGADNHRILENLQGLGGYLGEHLGKQLWIRTPLIPGATLNEANIIAIGAWLAEYLPGQVERWELCAFNNLCRDKYRRLGLAWDFVETPLLGKVEMKQAEKWAKSTAFDPARVFVTGAVRVESI